MREIDFDNEGQIAQGLRRILGHNVMFHHYNYAYPGWQEEEIRSRIRQGVGGPKHLKVGAEVHGHLHVPADKLLLHGDIYPMEFGDDIWNVEITQFSGDSVGTSMIVQGDHSVDGFEIQGTCVEKASG